MFILAVMGWEESLSSHPSKVNKWSDGFTIIELMVVIGIIAVLVALALPALGLVRRKSLELKSQANLRQIGQTTTMYTGEYRSYYFGTSGTLRPDDETNPGIVSFPIWSLSLNWPVLVHRVASWESNIEVWVSPRGDLSELRELVMGPRTQVPVPVSYHYSKSFVADPMVWDTVRRDQASETDIRATLPASVRYPSGKVLMFDAYRPYLQREPTVQDRRPVLFADGSSKMVLDTEAADPVINPLEPGVAPYWYHNTPNGVYGRDF